LGVLPVKFLYKKVAIAFIVKSIVKDETQKFYDGKRECRVYSIPVKYTRKAFGRSFVNYLGPVYFNSMPLSYKTNIYRTKDNPKKIICMYI